MTHFSHLTLFSCLPHFSCLIHFTREYLNKFSKFKMSLYNLCENIHKASILEISNDQSSLLPTEYSNETENEIESDELKESAIFALDEKYLKKLLMNYIQKIQVKQIVYLLMMMMMT